MSTIQLIQMLTVWARVEIGKQRQDQRGAMTTETVIIVAIMAALALAVGAIIVAKVTSKAESIPTN